MKYLLIILTLIILGVINNNLNQSQEGFTNPSDTCFTGKYPAKSSDEIKNFWMSTGSRSASLDDCAKKYSVKWQNDPLIFKNREVPDNPFAKDRGSHCRSDKQCKSGQCCDWFCL